VKKDEDGREEEEQRTKNIEKNQEDQRKRSPKKMKMKKM